ncbi:PspC domain-containing protein [Streptomyces sp. NPDC023838]|uniref:PspC domain-containing protein n=1 Tax=Streptomyces sp. NPDC023838 TaxID=3154325 RepID=UPI00340149D7
MTQPTETPVAPPDPDPDPAPAAPQLRRSGHNKVIGGVCGGLGRYCDIDPVIFRIALGVLTVTGGLGLVFYGFGWLLLPLDDEDENEARRLLSGRVEGPALAAVLMALAGCGIFLSMLSNGSVMSFAWLLTLAVAGLGVWSQRRSGTHTDIPVDAAADRTAPGVASPAFGPGAAPPETKAPPTPVSPSWWRDPIVKDGTTGPVGTGYLWGAEGADALPASEAGARAKADRAKKAADRATRGPRPIGGFVFLLALLAGGVGTAGAWSHQPLGTALQIGLTAALVVFGLGLVISAFVGRTGFGTLFMAVLTAALLAGASALPKTITTQWTRTDWAPVAAADVQPSYALGSGEGTLDLSKVAVPVGQSVKTRAEVGAGRLKVVVPRGATVKAHIVVGVGDVQLPTEKPEDVDIQPNQKKTVTLPPPAGAAPAGTLELDLHVSIGQAEVDRAAS